MIESTQRTFIVLLSKPLTVTIEWLTGIKAEKRNNVVSVIIGPLQTFIVVNTQVISEEVNDGGLL